MWFDIAAVFIVAIAAIVGMMRGIVSQLFGLIAFAGAVVIARLGGPLFGRAVLTRWLEADRAALLGVVVAGVGGYILIRLLLNAIFGSVGKKTEGSEELAGWNQFLGALFSVTEAALLSLVVLWALDVSGPEFRKAYPKASAQFRTSKVANFAHRINPLRRKEVEKLVPKIREQLDKLENMGD